MAIINCPECGKQVSNQAELCPHCGIAIAKLCIEPNETVQQNISESKLRFLNNPSKIILFIIPFILIIALVIIFCLGNTFNSVEQLCFEVELGETVDLLKCVSYDSEKIDKVIISNDEDFNSNISGKYVITYTFTSTNGKTKDFQYEIIVKDTVAPTINVKSDEIYIIQNSEFDISDYAESTDKSGTQIIEYDGKIDATAEGQYNIAVYAKDSSNNISKKKNVIVYVENRENCDIRNAYFGDSREIVERFEKEKNGRFVEGDEYNVLSYETTISGDKTTIIYYFNNNDELYLVIYVVDEIHSDYNMYYIDYQEIEENLIDKYGNPSKERTYTGSLYDYCDDEGEALMLGAVSYTSLWELENMEILHTMSNDNGINHIYTYRSNEYFETSDKSGY